MNRVAAVGRARTQVATVLVDMDGVLCDFEGQFLRRWREAHPAAAWIPLSERATHYVDRDPAGVYVATNSPVGRSSASS